MKILAIESSCDDTAVSIVEDGHHVISSIVSSQIEEHKLYGGVVPEIASRRHIESIAPLVKAALSRVDFTLNDIQAIGVTYAPGLVGSLLVGINFAKGLAIMSDLPIIPVHHIKAHVASLYLTNIDLKPPFMCLVVSGGHSHILEVRTYTQMRIIGRTRDDAAGEAFDKIGRCLGFPYPGGITLDRIAERGDSEAFKLPIPLRSEENTYDFSFSGLKTAMMNIINNMNQKDENLPIEDLSASFRKSVVDCLVEKLILAAQNYGYTSVAVAGGVSANSLLRKQLAMECSKRNYEFVMPDLKYCGDNAAMVGAQAYYEFLQGKRGTLGLNALATMPVDLD